MAVAVVGFVFPHAMQSFLEESFTDKIIHSYRDDADLQNFIDFAQAEVSKFSEGTKFQWFSFGSWCQRKSCFSSSVVVLALKDTSTGRKMNILIAVHRVWRNAGCRFRVASIRQK